MESDTPRTDEELKRITSMCDGDSDDTCYVMDQLGKHARELERELAAAIKERDEARRDACVNMAMLRLRDMYGDGFVTREDALQMAKEIAAERGWDCFKGGGA